MNINISFEERDQLLNMDLDTGDSSMDNGFGESMLLAGPPGMSAYEVALSNGYMGTEAEWLASLRGEQGIPGIQGPAGAAGRDGADGKDGKDGIDGRDGVSATHSWNDTVLTITSASGTSSADLQGARGAAGKDGYTPIRGTDYWTEADKREIVEEVATEIPAPVVSWNDLEDKPFSKEVDSAVYTTSTLGQLEYPKQNAEDYTHGTKLCETTYMPGSVTVTVDNFVSNKSVPLVPTNQYYALGKFEINGRKFGIYSAYMGRGYELYLLGMSSDGLYGQTFRVSDIAKIKYLPTEYINIVDVMSMLKLPATWASLPDKPFDVVEQPVSYPIQGFTANTVYGAETYPYISALITTVSSVPYSVDITAFGNYTLTVRESNDFGFISDTFSSGPVRESAVRFEPNNSGGWDVYVLSKSAWTDSWNGYVSSFSYVTPLDFKVLPMGDIIAAVKEALPRYNGEVADV